MCDERLQDLACLVVLRIVILQAEARNLGLE